MVEMVININ